MYEKGQKETGKLMPVFGLTNVRKIVTSAALSDAKNWQTMELVSAPSNQAPMGLELRARHLYY